MTLHPRTIAALDRIAAPHGVSYAVREHEVVVDLGDYAGRSHLHLLDDGQWLVACWDEEAQAYKSPHVPTSVSSDSGPTRNYARSLKALARDVTTYRSAPEAMRAAVPAEWEH